MLAFVANDIAVAVCVRISLGLVGMSEPDQRVIIFNSLVVEVGALAAEL